VRHRLGVEDEFILFVGTVEPRKNLLTLVRAFDELLRTTNLRPQLVIAGQKGWLTDELFGHVEQSAVTERVLFTGYVSDADLCALYSSCRVSVYPSLYEGFGLPVLEAMACGTPVVVAPEPALREVAGDAALYADRAELADAIRQAVRERDRLAAAGFERAKEFSWRETARRTLAVYLDALDAR
jgi:glycosyltransferase involved in cell wall biosynthesis